MTWEKGRFVYILYISLCLQSRLITLTPCHVHIVSLVVSVVHMEMNEAVVCMCHCMSVGL